MKKILVVAVLFFVFLVGSSFYNTAITLQNRKASKGSPVYIYNNQITNCRIGLHAINMAENQAASYPNGLIIGMDAAGNYGNNFRNKIFFNLGPTPDPSIYYGGIWLQNCPGAKVVSNEITNNAPATGTENFRGIDVEASVNCRINCNEISNLPFSMRYMGHCEGTLLRANVLTEYDEGIHLDGATLPDQFQVNDQTGDHEPTDNVWNDPPQPTGQPTDRVTGTLSGINPIAWHYQSGTNCNNSFNPLDCGTTSQILAIIPPDPPGTVACDDFTNRQSRDERFGAVVGDSLQFAEYEEENIYLAKSNAYKAMKEDNTIINTGSSGDVAYQNFFNAMDASNIGIFDSINRLAGDSATIAAALSINNSVNDTNNFEYYRKLMNEIHLNTIAQDLALTETDSATCDYVSSLSYYVAGDAIYAAAAMIGKEIHPAYVAMRKTHHSPPKETINKLQELSVFPNPANESIQIKGLNNETAEIKIFDLLGNLLLQRKIIEDNTEISIRELSVGIYRISIYRSNAIIKEVKFSIIK